MSIKMLTLMHCWWLLLHFTSITLILIILLVGFNIIVIKTKITNNILFESVHTESCIVVTRVSNDCNFTSKCSFKREKSFLDDDGLGYDVMVSFIVFNQQNEGFPPILSPKFKMDIFWGTCALIVLILLKKKHMKNSRKCLTITLLGHSIY